MFFTIFVHLPTTLSTNVIWQISSFKLDAICERIRGSYLNIISIRKSLKTYFKISQNIFQKIITSKQVLFCEALSVLWHVICYKYILAMNSCQVIAFLFFLNFCFFIQYLMFLRLNRENFTSKSNYSKCKSILTLATSGRFANHMSEYAFILGNAKRLRVCVLCSFITLNLGNRMNVYKFYFSNILELSYHTFFNINVK